jgi:esterase/lipase
VKQHKLAAVVVFLAGLAALIFFTTPPALVNAASTAALPDDIDAFLAASERNAAAAFPLIPNTEKRIVWREPSVRSKVAVVYLHGFSATRQETAPLAEQVAIALEANLFETRLRGHGRAESPLLDVTAEDWLDDVTEALAIGARIGEQVIVIGTSTGGTLALAMSQHEAAKSVTHFILISPNIQPSNETAHWATRPAGRLIARLFVGPTRSWEPRNEQQARYWSTTYPTAAAIEVMRLVDYVNALLPLDLDANLLVMMSPDDKVVSPLATQYAFNRIDAPRKKIIEFLDSHDPSSHVLAGDILAPQSTPGVAARIVEFIAAGSAPEL